MYIYAYICISTYVVVWYYRRGWRNIEQHVIRRVCNCIDASYMWPTLSRSDFKMYAIRVFRRGIFQDQTTNYSKTNSSKFVGLSILFIYLYVNKN